VSFFTEVKRHKPSIIYIPNIESWYDTIKDTVAYITFKAMLKSIPPTDPILVLATAENEFGGTGKVAAELLRDIFAFSRKNRLEIARPKKVRCRHMLRRRIPLILCRKTGTSTSQLLSIMSARAPRNSLIPPTGRSACWKSFPWRRRLPLRSLRRRRSRLCRSVTTSC